MATEDFDNFVAAWLPAGRLTPQSVPINDRGARAVERIFAKLEGAYAPRTIVAYRADFYRFSTWCEDLGLHSFPAAPKTVARYVLFLSRSLKITTLRRMIACIRRLHQLAAVVDPTTHIDVQFALRRAARRQVARPRQALGITFELRQKLMATCGEDLCGQRDKALLAVGFETLARASELVAFNVENLQRHYKGGSAILIARGKTDLAGFGRLVVLSRRTSALLTDWLVAADIDRGPIFRPIYQGHVVPRRLESRRVGRILKERARVAGLREAEAISGHSLRVGAAQQLTINGHGLPQIMRAGGWRSITTVARYIESAEMTLWEDTQA